MTEEEDCLRTLHTILLSLPTRMSTRYFHIPLLHVNIHNGSSVTGTLAYTGGECSSVALRQGGHSGSGDNHPGTCSCCCDSCLNNDVAVPCSWESSASWRCSPGSAWIRLSVFGVVCCCHDGSYHCCGIPWCNGGGDGGGVDGANGMMAGAEVGTPCCGDSRSFYGRPPSS